MSFFSEDYLSNDFQLTNTPDPTDNRTMENYILKF